MMSDIDLEKIYSPSEDIVAREIEGELIIVPLVAGIGDMEDELFTLNETGKAIWRRLNGKKSLKGVIEDLQLEYDVDSAVLEKDVLGLVNELVKRRMLIEQTGI
jgi:hypothetical protein